MEEPKKRQKDQGGRPALGSEKKTHKVTFTVTHKQHQTLMSKAGQAGVALPAYAREMTVNGSVKAVHTEQAQAQRLDFIRLSNNLNQLTKQAHIQGLKGLVSRFEEAMNELDYILKKYKA